MVVSVFMSTSFSVSRERLATFVSPGSDGRQWKEPGRWEGRRKDEREEKEGDTPQIHTSGEENVKGNMNPVWALCVKYWKEQGTLNNLEPCYGFYIFIL